MNTNSFLLQTGTGFATQWSDCFPLCNAIRLWFPNFLSLWITDRPPNFNQIQVALKSLKHVAQQWHIAGMMALNFSPNSSGRRQICVQGIGAGQGKLCELLHDGFTEAKKKKKKIQSIFLLLWHSAAQGFIIATSALPQKAQTRMHGLPWLPQ